MVSRTDVMKMSVDELYQFLKERFNEDTVERESLKPFLENRVNGESFLELKSDELAMLVPKLGERKAIERLLQPFRQPSLTVCTSLNNYV